jgi:hypothetical protein
MSEQKTNSGPEQPLYPSDQSLPYPNHTSHPDELTRTHIIGSTRCWVHSALYVGPGPIFFEGQINGPKLFHYEGEYLEVHGWKWYYFDAQR